MITPLATRDCTRHQSALSPEAASVRAALIKAGLETPMLDNPLTRDEKVATIDAAFQEITRALGLDLTDDSLQDTPKRAYGDLGPQL